MSESKDRLKDFIIAMRKLVDEADGDEAIILRQGKDQLAELVRHDDWLPQAFAKADSECYQQNLLYCDPLERFCVVSFVWGPGQETPIHDHTTWGLVGMLRGAELSQSYQLVDDKPVAGETERLEPGEVVMVSPTVGDIHRVQNAFDDRPSISIHVYGGNIGAIERNVFPPDGGVKRFISGYANAELPNFWR